MFTWFTNFRNILFSNQAHFHLNGHVNKHNFKYWSEVKPQLKHQRPLHSPKVTVWVAMSSKGIICPYFFESTRGISVTVNSAEYVKMVLIFFHPQLQHFDGYNNRTCLRQDGAIYHTSNESLPVVKEMFRKKVISRIGDIPLLPRSPDLTPLDFFLWGYLKSRIHIHKPATIIQLKENIRQEIINIPCALCRKERS